MKAEGCCVGEEGGNRCPNGGHLQRLQFGYAGQEVSASSGRRTMRVEAG